MFIKKGEQAGAFAHVNNDNKAWRKAIAAETREFFAPIRINKRMSNHAKKFRFHQKNNYSC
jgi:hypothetical protein